MRKKLKDLEGERATFIGIFKRFGSKSYKNHKKRTLLLGDIKLKKTGEPVTDHLWFNYTRRFKSLGNFEGGDKIRFDARVKEYNKGYYHSETDYKLNYPTKIEKIDWA